MTPWGALPAPSPVVQDNEAPKDKGECPGPNKPFAHRRGILRPRLAWSNTPNGAIPRGETSPNQERAVAKSVCSGQKPQATDTHPSSDGSDVGECWQGLHLEDVPVHDHPSEGSHRRTRTAPSVGRPRLPGDRSSIGRKGTKRGGVRHGDRTPWSHHQEKNRFEAGNSPFTEKSQVSSSSI